MTRSERVEKQFERVAMQVIGDAADVDCSLNDYICGLKMIIDELNISLEAAERDRAAAEAAEE